MSKKEPKELYVERRPEGYAVLRPSASRASDIQPTQTKAIDSAKGLEPKAAIHVARVRHTAKGKPGQWRNP
jgi:hypothetical protein